MMKIIFTEVRTGYVLVQGFVCEVEPKWGRAIVNSLNESIGTDTVVFDLVPLDYDLNDI